MSIVPASRVSPLPRGTETVLLALGVGAAVWIGSSNGQLQDFRHSFPMSSNYLAPIEEILNIVPPLIGCPIDASARGRSTASVLAETREVSGLTWEQIAKYFGVSRRAVHLWASGGRMTASNEELLAHIVRAVEAVRHLAPADRRQALLASDSGLNIIDAERARRSSRETDINRPPRTGIAVD